MPVKLSARAVVDKMIAGEFAIALQTFITIPSSARRKARASRWFPLDLAMINVSVEA